MGFISNLFKPKVTVPKQEVPAADAIVAPAGSTTQESEVDTAGKSLKRKAAGKRSLMINSSSIGGTSGGTGLNV